MTEGVVTGGWGFVWAAYGITAAAFLIYGISLVARVRDAVQASKGVQRKAK